uniref:Uncharacterized protein n=1 Tax=Xiphophorus couchianus TaxID=32473 RepID=A0A3B5M2C4_9TELE
MECVVRSAQVNLQKVSNQRKWSRARRLLPMFSRTKAGGDEIDQQDSSPPPLSGTRDSSPPPPGSIRDSSLLLPCGTRDSSLPPPGGTRDSSVLPPSGTRDSSPPPPSGTRDSSPLLPCGTRDSSPFRRSLTKLNLCPVPSLVSLQTL